MAFAWGVKIKTVEFSAGKGDITAELLDKLPGEPVLLVIYEACIGHLELFQPLEWVPALFGPSGSSSPYVAQSTLGKAEDRGSRSC